MHRYVRFPENPEIEKLTVFETHEMHAGDFMHFAQTARRHDLADRVDVFPNRAASRKRRESMA